jgi:hypothetical protein
MNSITYMASAHHTGDVTNRREFPTLEEAEAWMRGQRNQEWFERGLINRRTEDGTMLPFSPRLQYSSLR